MALKHVVIGGGTGYIGSSLAIALANQGIKVTIVSRMPGPRRMNWHDVEMQGLPEDVTDVINVAGQNILDLKCRWTPGFKQLICDSRIETNSVLSRAILSTKAKTLITISGVAYYPPDGKEYTEEDKCKPYDFFSELCHKWEAAAQLPQESNIRQVIIRSGIVLGRTGGMVQQLFPAFFMGLGGPMGNGQQYMPWIHIHDLVRLFEHALLSENLKGVLNGVAPQPITNKEFTEEFASALWRPAIFPLPAFMINLLFGKERAKIILEGQKVIPKRVLESKFEYKFPNIKSACRDITILAYPHPY